MNLQGLRGQVRSTQTAVVRTAGLCLCASMVSRCSSKYKRQPASFDSSMVVSGYKEQLPHIQQVAARSLLRPRDPEVAGGQTDQVRQSTPTLREAEAECPFPVPGCPMPSFTSSTCDPAAFLSRFPSGVFRGRYMTSQRPSCDLEAAASSLPPPTKTCRNYAAAYPNLWIGALFGDSLVWTCTRPI